MTWPTVSKGVFGWKKIRGAHLENFSVEKQHAGPS